MKLHTFPPSPNAIKVWAVVHHLGLEVESVMVDFSQKSTHTDDYRAMNPNARMPLLEDGDFYLWESNAIMQYLAHKAGDETLWPSDPRAQADVSRWQCWQLAHWSGAMSTFLYENVVKGMFGLGDPDSAKVSEAVALFHPMARVLDDHLRERDYLCGDQLTLAEYSICAPLRYAEEAGIPWQEYPALRAWYVRVAERDCWKKAALTE